MTFPSMGNVHDLSKDSSKWIRQGKSNQSRRCRRENKSKTISSREVRRKEEVCNTTYVSSNYLQESQLHMEIEFNNRPNIDEKDNEMAGLYKMYHTMT